jgi:hypothetical protein
VARIVTDCRKCSTYARLGEICPIEHGKTYYWEFCRDFKPVTLTVAARSRSTLRSK